MKLCGSVLCVLLLAIVRAVVGAPTDYASVRAEVVKAYAQQAEEMARALEVLQETSASTSAAAHVKYWYCCGMAIAVWTDRVCVDCLL